MSVSDYLLSSDADTQKRRSTRIVQAIPIAVTGVDALGQPFKERTTTVMVNCHGCKYQSKHYVPKNSVVTLDIPRLEPGGAPRTVLGRVIWVQRPRTVRELFQIGLEFDVPGNVWGIAFPPDDWDPVPAEGSAEPAPQEPAAAPPPAASAATEVRPQSSPVASTPAPVVTPPSAPAAPPVESKIHVVPPV